MRILASLIIGIAFVGNLKCQAPYVLLWDNDASSISSAEGLITTQKVLYDFKDKYIKPSYWQEDNWKRKSLGIGYRILKTMLLDVQIDYLAFLHQHEVFGHGARYREFDLVQNSYHITLAPPYHGGGGFAQPGKTLYSRQFGVHENISIHTGGMEATAVLAKTLRDKWLLSSEISYGQSSLFLISILDNTHYILITKFFGTDGDVKSYLSRVNSYYGYPTEESYKLTLNDMSVRSSINTLNTYSLFAFYAFFKVYLIDGKETVSIPMINVGNVKWLPSVRFGLAPFGSELIFENHFLKRKNLLELSLRLGDNKLAQFWGAGFKIRKEFKESLVVESKLDFWNQPSMRLGGISRYDTKDGYGGRLTGVLNWYFNRNIPIGLYAEVGYKTTGYIEGEELGEDVIIRLGISIRERI